MDITIDSQITAKLVSSMGNDQSIIDAARVSTGSASDPAKDEGLLRFLMANRHASPFEHVTATFLVDAPIFVAREWMRHRTQSFNEVSGRYKELEPRFYIPPAERPLIQKGKPGAYTFEPGSNNQYVVAEILHQFSFESAWTKYQLMLANGIAREVARNVLPVAIYTQFFATANLRNWLNFLSLRTHETALHEIQEGAADIEVALLSVAPTSMRLWNELGRGQL